MNILKKHPPIIYIAVTFAVIFVGLIIYSVLYFIIPQSTLSLSLAPEEVMVSIDGGSKKLVKNKQNLNVTPGKHTLVFQQNEFESITQEINIDNKQTLRVVVALEALTDNARKLLSTNAATLVIEEYEGRNMTEYIKTLQEKNPILQVLPIQARLYTINVCKSIKRPTDKTIIAVCVDSNQNRKDIEPYVKKHISSLGYNLDDYEVIWAKTK